MKALAELLLVASLGSAILSELRKAFGWEVKHFLLRE